MGTQNGLAGREEVGTSIDHLQPNDEQTRRFSSDTITGKIQRLSYREFRTHAVPY